MLGHHKPVENQALCPKRHSPEEGNIDQVLNAVLENSMAEKYEMCVHPGILFVWPWALQTSQKSSMKHSAVEYTSKDISWMPLPLV